MMETRDTDGSTDRWICPHCGGESATIIEDSVLEDDFREILCGCGSCDGLFIRKYKYVETFKLERKSTGR